MLKSANFRISRDFLLRQGDFAFWMVVAIIIAPALSSWIIHRPAISILESMSLTGVAIAALSAFFSWRTATASLRVQEKMLLEQQRPVFKMSFGSDGVPIPTKPGGEKCVRILNLGTCSVQLLGVFARAYAVPLTSGTAHSVAIEFPAKMLEEYFGKTIPAGDVFEFEIASWARHIWGELKKLSVDMLPSSDQSRIDAFNAIRTHEFVIELYGLFQKAGGGPLLRRSLILNVLGHIANNDANVWSKWPKEYWLNIAERKFNAELETFLRFPISRKE